MTKSLGQINYESHQPLRAVHWPWADLSVEFKTFFENGAEAVVAHVRAGDAKPSMPAVSTVDHSELLQKIRKAAGDADGKLMQDELVARIAANAKRDTPTGWQPIETAPRDGTTILLYGPVKGQWLDNLTIPVAATWVIQPEELYLLGAWFLTHKHEVPFWRKATHWLAVPPRPTNKKST